MKGNDMKKQHRELLPQQFMLFGQQWTIRTGSKQEMDDNLGLCVVDDFEILIQAQQCQQSQSHTLLHELCHSIEQKLHLNLSEAQVDLMALGLLDLFTNNPRLLEIFKERTND